MVTKTRLVKLMGSAFELGVSSERLQDADKYLQAGIAEIQRIEALLSSFLSDSETSRINCEAFAEGVKVSKECFELIRRSIHISRLTAGSFDITVGPLKKLYNFKGKGFAMPSQRRIRETLQCVGFHRIVLDDRTHTVKLTHPKTRIGFEAIGKGYASDRVKKLWLQSGVTSGFINASGDLNVIGCKANGEPWNIGIADPDKPDTIKLHLPLRNNAVATSGDYEQFFLYRGKRYSHNINPHTGAPLSEVKSVTVCSPSAELSDALATAIGVKGISDGINFVNQLPNTHAIIIDSKNHYHFSKHFSYEEISSY
ncbi:MAG: FAD:protein FMN transferase [Bacteroidota bacterium]